MSVQAITVQHGRIAQPACFAAADAMPPGDFLSEGEKEQFGEFRFAAKKEAFLLGRLAAKSALAALLSEPDLRGIEIHPGVYGQPLIRHPRAGALGVTVSHSHGLAVAMAFPAEYPMGVDLEAVSAMSAGTIIGELEMSAAEQAWLASSGVDEATACGLLWTAREALGKALGIGLNSPLRLLSLGEIRSGSGDATWVGRYLNFPRCKCLLQAAGGRVLSLAMPADAELSSPPFLDRLNPGPWATGTPGFPRRP